MSTEEAERAWLEAHREVKEATRRLREAERDYAATGPYQRLPGVLDAIRERCPHLSPGEWAVIHELLAEDDALERAAWMVTRDRSRTWREAVEIIRRAMHIRTDGKRNAQGP
jgi:hypothetical protein